MGWHFKQVVRKVLSAKLTFKVEKKGPTKESFGGRGTRQRVQSLNGLDQNEFFEIKTEKRSDWKVMSGLGEGNE